MSLVNDCDLFSPAPNCLNGGIADALTGNDCKRPRQPQSWWLWAGSSGKIPIQPHFDFDTGIVPNAGVDWRTIQGEGVSSPAVCVALACCYLCWEPIDSLIVLHVFIAGVLVAADAWPDLTFASKAISPVKYMLSIQPKNKWMCLLIRLLQRHFRVSCSSHTNKAWYTHGILPVRCLSFTWAVGAWLPLILVYHVPNILIQ